MQAGDKIQNYTLVKFLGDGGMGQVWLGEHTLLGRKVAIKGLHPQFARNAAIRARFKQEAATLAHLQHPNIVALHDYIEEGDAAYLVMEYVDGLPLDDYIRHKTGPIPTPQLKQLFGQILDGFVYAHGKQIVHRDIKPSNFLVTADGVVKILDFGIAKILSGGQQQLTKTGTNLGTVLYMSPEQVRGEAVDARSDIYSLGVTLFQMATGQCPYDSETAEYVVYDKIVNQPLPKASGIYPGVTADIEAVIVKATEKVAARRYQDCGEFKRGLMAEFPQSKPEVHSPEPIAVDAPQPVLQPVPVSPTPSAPAASVSSESPPAAQKRKFPRVTMVVLAAVVMIAVTLGIWQPWKSIGSSANPDSGDGLTPTETIERFYSKVGNGDWEAAYGMTIEQAFGNSPSALAKFFECVDCCGLRSTELDSKTESSAAVNAEVRLSGCGKRPAKIAKLEFRLRRVKGEWRIQGLGR